VGNGGVDVGVDDVLFTYIEVRGVLESQNMEICYNKKARQTQSETAEKQLTELPRMLTVVVVVR